MLLSSADFFQNHLFQNILSGIPSECQTGLIQIRPDVSPDLIWVQNVCKSYQQMTLGGRELMFADLRTDHRKFYCKRELLYANQE